MGKKEAAKYTGLCSDTLDYHSLVVGDLKRYKLAGKVLYKKSDLDRFVESYLDVTCQIRPGSVGGESAAETEEENGAGGVRIGDHCFALNVADHDTIQ